MYRLVCFENGQFSYMYPKPAGDYYDNRDLIYDASTIRSDGIEYQLRSIDSIKSIAIPNYQGVGSIHDGELGVTGFLEYALRMRAGRYWRSGEFDLSIACLEKATELMKYSPVAWQKKDFYRIVSDLEELGRFSQARKWEKWIDENSPSETAIFERRYAEVLESCRTLGTDLVLIPWAGGQSAVSAKYQGRVYSLDGETKKFPILPRFIREKGYVHPHGAYVANPIIFFNDRHLDTLYYKGMKCPVLSTSWRPFIDDRSDDEKNNFLNRQKEINGEKENRLVHSVYYRIKYLLPNDCPKSISAFSRIRNEGGTKYQELIIKVECAGFMVPDMQFPVVEPDDPEPEYHGGRRKPFIFPWQ